MILWFYLKVEQLTEKGLQEISDILNAVVKEAKGPVQTHFINLKQKNKDMSWQSDF